MCPVDGGVPRRSAARTVLLLAGILGAGIALALVIVNRRATLSNESVPPERNAGGQLGVETPNLEGPDGLELAPLVALTKTGFAFDHELVDQAGLESRLRTYRANFSLLHPGEPPPKEVLLACSPGISSERVFAVLGTARLLGFDRARLVFETLPSEGSAPAVGKQPPRITAAQVSIGADSAPRGAGRLARSSGLQSCSQLAERVIAFRRAGLPVTLVVGAAN